MNVYLHELKTYLKSALIWSISLAFFGVVICAVIFPAFHNDMQAVNDILANYPPEALSAMGVGPDGISSFPGFYAFCFIYVLLCGAIQALILGAGIVGKEGARKTSDFLFSKPLSRTGILTGKYLASVTCLFITSLIYCTAVYFSAAAVIEELNVSVVWMMNASLFVVQLLFVSIGFAIACFVTKLKSPNTVGIGLGALFFGLQMLANMYPEDLLIRLISPMGYLLPNYIAQHHTYEWPLFAVSLALTAVLTVLGYVRFNTKDIHST